MRKTTILFLLVLMGLFGHTIHSVRAQECDYDTIPWGVGISNGLCWTVQDSTWNVNEFYATISNSATAAQHWLLTPWFEVPAWTATDPVGFVWTARAVKNADVMILATVDGMTFDTLFDGLIYPSDNNYSSSYTANPVTHTVLLGAYAGQTVRLAFVYQTGSSRFSLTTGYMRLDLLDFELRTVMHPVAVLTVPEKAFTHEATRMSATLSEGSTVGLTYSWHSQLMGTTYYGDMVDITYNTEGIDTIMMVASNNYAADTHWVALPVYGCPLVTARPWIVDWENDIDCWRQVAGSAWSKGYYNSTATLFGGSGYSGVIASPRVVVSTDTAGLRLQWKDKKWSSNVTYYVMVTTGNVDDLMGYDTVGVFTANNSSNFVARSVSLAAYAGDTVHIALRRNSGGNTLYIQDFRLLSDSMPQATLEAPAYSVRIGDTVQYSVRMQQGGDSLLSFGWSSVMVQSGLGTMVAIDSVLKVVYSGEGIDSVYVTVSNAYGSMELSSTMGVFACDTVRTFPWEEEFADMGSEASYNACWQMVGWSHIPANQQHGFQTEDGGYMYKNDMMQSGGGDNYMITPPIAVPTEGVANLALWVQYKGTITVLLSADGDSAMSLFADTLLVADDNNTYSIRTVPLAPYAGQTLHVAFTAYNSSKYIDRVALDLDTLPKLSQIIASSKTRTDSTAVCNVSLLRGCTTGATFTWHSSLMNTVYSDTTGINSQFSVSYDHGGIDTITVVATNGYGSDSTWTTIEVEDCTPVTTLPWSDDFAKDDICWYKPEGSNWHVAVPSYYPNSSNYRALVSGTPTDSADHWTVSKAVVLPTDPSAMPTLFWDASSTNSNSAYQPHYSVLVSTAADPTDLTAFSPVFFDTIGLVYSGSGWSNHIRRSVSLSAYAGQTIHMAFCNHPLNGYTAGLVVDNVTIRSVAVPSLSFTASNSANSHEMVNYTATLSEGSNNGLSISLHSSLLDTTFTVFSATSHQFQLYYPLGGTDTVRVIATNAFGADTVTRVVTVNQCLVSEMPWTEDFSSTTSVSYSGNGKIPTCWHRYWNGSNANYSPHVIGSYLSNTAINTYCQSNRALLFMAGNDNGWDTEATVESPIFEYPINGLLLSFYYMYESTQYGTLRVGYLQDSTFVGIADIEPKTYGLYDTVSLVGIPADINRFALRWENDGTWYGAIVDNVSIFAPDTLPSVIVNAPETAYVGDNTQFQAVLTNGLTDNLTFTWHSTMLDTTITLSTQQFVLNYQTEGLDTVTVIASTAYGSDTAWVAVSIESHPLPHITLAAPAEVYVDETNSIGATINSCSANGLGYSLHSTLLDSTWSGVMAPSTTMNRNVMYTEGGIDTLTLVAANIYGSDTATTIVRVHNCQGNTLPFHEDFSTVSGTFPFCWSYQWDGNTSTAPHMVDSGSNRYLQMQAGGYDSQSANYYTNTSIVTLPSFNDTLNRYAIALRYCTTNSYCEMSLGYMSSGTFVTYTNLANQGSTIITDTIALDELPDSVSQLSIRWHKESDSWSSYMLYIYEIDIFVESYVYGPNNLHVDSLGAQCVRLAWNPMLDATAYSVQIEGVGETVVTTTFAEMCGLAPNTQYTARVACLNGNDTGNYVAIQFTTLCNIVELPWFEDFEGTSPLQCWSQQGGGYISLPSSDFGFYYNAFAHSGTNLLIFDNNSHERSGFAVSPQIDFPGDELIVSFWACSSGADSVEAGVFTVQGDTSSFVPMVHFQLTSTPTHYEFDTRNLSDGNLSIAFRLQGYSYGIFIDDITVERIEDCARLRSVSSYPVSATSAVVEWQYDTASAIPNTGALVSLTDLDDSTVAPMVVTVTGNSHTFTGLALSHRYQASVQALCANDTTVALTTLVVPSGNVCAERSGSYSHWWSMINCDRPYSYSQTLYPAVLAATIDTLFGIAYHITSSSVEQYPSSYNTYSDGPRIVDVFIGQTSDNTLTSPVSAANLTLAVQNYELSVADTGWVRINFTNPVPLDGVSNLIVTIDDNTGALYGDVSFSHHTDSPGVRFHTSSASYSYTQTYDPYNPSSFNPMANMQIPDIQLLGGCSGDRCLQPLVTVTDEDTHSVSLAWQQRGSESLWRIEYHVEGDSLWIVAGTTIDTFYTIGGLNASTGYKVRVASLCSSDMVYSDVHRVHTACGVVSLPYHQTFRADYMPNTQSSIDENGTPCWQTGNISLLSQERGLWNTNQNGDYIISPEIGSDLNGVMVSLTASGSTFFLAGLKVGVCSADGSNLQWIDSITLADNAQEYTVYMNNYYGNERHIAIGGSYQGWTLYDVVVEYISTCLPVHHVSLGYLGDTSVVLHWPAVAEYNSWAVYLDNTMVGVANDTMFAIGNLTPSTSYTVGVREICYAGDTAVATTLGFTTLCTVSLPWNETFDGGVDQQVPACWYPIFRNSVGFVNKAYILGSNSNPYLYFFDSYSLYHDTDTVANFLCSPVIHAGGRSVLVSFSARKTISAGLFQAGIMTNSADTSSFIPVITLTSYNATMEDYQFTTDSIDLPDRYCLAFRSWGLNLTVVDNINVSLVPLPSYTVTLSVNDTVMGSVSGDGTYEVGSIATFTAVANEGYHFVMWNDSVRENPRTVRVVADMSFVAYFAADSVPPVAPDTVWRNVTVTANAEGMCELYGGGTYVDSSVVEIGFVVTDTLAEGGHWHFTGWSDGGTGNPRAIMVVSDTTIMALFEWVADSTLGIDNSQLSTFNSQLSVFPNPATTKVIIEGLEPGSRLVVMDISGRIVDELSVRNARQEYDVSQLPRGAYFIRSFGSVGTRTAKLILR